MNPITWSRAIITALLLVATDTQADPFAGNIRNYADPIAWKFTVLTDGSLTIHSPGVVDYSHDLEQDLAVSLPIAMIKEGWACVRDAVVNDHDGGFTCKNGQVEISNHVDCFDTSTQRNQMKVWDTSKSSLAPFGAQFVLVAECNR
jgi:hypothetical protein